MSFEPVRALLNPAFESYKLASDVLQSQCLGIPLSKPAAGDSAKLSWKDLRARARWNRLVASEDAQEIAWLEPSRREVWVARFDGDWAKASKLFDFPPLVSSEAAAQEMPTLTPAGPGRYAFSNGQGALHVISSDGRHLSAAHLQIDGQPRSFRLHACDAPSSTALLSLNVPREGSSKQPAVFDIAVVRLPKDGELDHGELEVVGRYRGDDIPSYAVALNGKWIVGADSPFKTWPAPAVAEQSTTAGQPEALQPTASAGYTWTQTSDSVDIDISDLPKTLKSNDFKISFSPQYISLLISHEGAPRFAHRELWAPVDAGSCSWSWEAEEQLLSLHIEKKDVGTSWTALFAAVPEEGEVAETLSDQQLADITSSLDKYTADVDDIPTDFESRAGLLGEDEEDVDDEDSSDALVFTELSTGKVGDRAAVVSEGLPRCGSRTAESLLIKRSYDGLLYTPALSDDGLRWTHSATFPALAFVLASKRNLRYRFHSSHAFALALEGGGLPSSSGAPGSNAYAYFPPAPGTRDRTAKQALISLGGAVVRGAAQIDDDRIAVLCEGRLEILSGFAAAMAVKAI